MNPLASRFFSLTLAAAVLAATGCTVAGPRTARDADGWETTTYYDCDWKSDGNWLRAGRVPNSPLIPLTRSNPVGSIVGVLPFMMDIAFSPIAYLTDRNCWATSAPERRYVGTPESQRQARLAQEKRERDEQAAAKAAALASERANSAAQKKADAEAAAARAEAEKIAAMYTPVNESPRSSPARPDDFALIVGIESYRSIAAKADFGENDAKSVRTYLEALGVPAGNVITLLGDKAGRSDIAKYLEEWLPGVVKPDSRVYFYYSGHGAPDPQTGTAYLVPFDGDPAFLKSTAFSLSKIYADLAALPARESVVMLDSCFSGAGGRSVLSPGVRPLVLMEDSTTAPEKVTVLSAAGAREIAGGLDLRQHGLFTYFMLRGLAGEADVQHSGHVTLGDLNEYVRTRVSETARRSNRDQTPRLLGDAKLQLY
jgi:hypothetical protein